jgi:hypothetical protein
MDEWHGGDDDGDVNGSGGGGGGGGGGVGGIGLGRAEVRLMSSHISHLRQELRDARLEHQRQIAVSS